MNVELGGTYHEGVTTDELAVGLSPVDKVVSSGETERILAPLPVPGQIYASDYSNCQVSLGNDIRGIPLH